MTSLRLAFRTLFKTPFVAAVAIVSLALGIGANTAIYSLFDQILLRPLPVTEPGRLVNLAAPPPKPGSTSCGQAGDCDTVFSYPMFRDLERTQTVFTGIAAHVLFGANLAARGQTTSTEGLLVSGSYFAVLGVQPALGRVLSATDDQAPGQSHVAVMSHAFWMSRFGGNPDVLDQSIMVNGQPFTVVGVAQAGFNGTTLGARPGVFLPITMRDLLQPGARTSSFEARRSYWAYLFARLKPGVSIEQATAALNEPYRAILNDVEAPLQTGMSDQTMVRFRARRESSLADGSRGQSSMSAEARAPLTLLLSVTILVLLIACANIANLLLARSAARAPEMALRLAIGARRGQLIRQLLVESCLLAGIGGAAGLLIAKWTLDLMVSLLPQETALSITFSLDRSILPFVAGVSIATGLLFGMFPALHSTRPDLIASLKGQAGQPSGARAAARFRVVLATTQIALSMTLLVAAGLFTRSLYKVSHVDLGLKVDNVITFRVAPSRNGLSQIQSLQLFERIENQLAALPGVISVTDSTVPLLDGSNWGNDLVVEGFDAGPDTDMNSRFNVVGAGYFGVLGTPLIAGREFTRTDVDGSTKVAVVNEAFARKFNLGTNPVGRRIGNRRENKLDTEIVGFVKNAKYSNVKDPVPPLFFRPYRQSENVGSLAYYVRTDQDPQTLLATVPRLVASIDPNLPVEDLRTMPQQVRDNVYFDRFVTMLSTAFALLATLLAAIGLYGVLSYTVSQRTRELGLRMALGADPGRLRRMVLGQVARMTVVGGMIGLTAATGLGRLAESLLYEMKGWDPAVFSGAALALALVALAAGTLPAHRAARVDPMRALRYD